ncbi:hypothetical protein [Halomonas sp. 25-S5]|uniref:hypothetical protein n=1 Tax=Halomonas sp. 25-S5 TaxID=2994065 RepID=UPI002468D946|nr:hypothetical protein [Halomonas sp. 25-S5]
MKKILASVALLAVSSGAFAQETYLEKDTLICFSEEAYDRQIRYLNQGVRKVIDGCGITKKEYRVIPMEYNTFSASVVEVIEFGEVVYVGNNGLDIRD